MILYYAIGGGLGHLTRARAVAHTLGFSDRMIVLSASEFAADPRFSRGIEIVKVPRRFERDVAEYRIWLAELIRRLSPTEIFFDTFPTGILGEFCDFSFPVRVRLNYLVRLLRIENYERQLSGEAPHFDEAFVIEELGQQQREFVARCSSRISHLALVDPAIEGDEQSQHIIRLIERQRHPVWLVVHSGPEEEVQQLIDFAEELRLSESSDAVIF